MSKARTLNPYDMEERIHNLEENGGVSADEAKRSDIATEFSATKSYTAGKFVYYQGKLYIFNVDHTAGAWDATEVAVANVTDEVTGNKAAIDALDDRVETLETTPRGYKVIAEFTGDGVKTYADAITELLPYAAQADMLFDGSNECYPRTNVVYFSINVSSAGTVTIYTVRFDQNNPHWKSTNVLGGTETDSVSEVVTAGRKLRLCKRL